ncbi:DUF3027 domain-containing protein [Nocardioides korecus]
MTSADPTAHEASAIDAARAALVEEVGAAVVGAPLEPLPEESTGGDALVVTHRFACTQAGYPGWVWAVTVAQPAGQDDVTVAEVVLLPGDDAIVAPAWVPWRERIQPGDLSPGDLLPTDEDDPRLVPTYLVGETPEEWERPVVDELGLGRARVLSLEGRDAATQRWYAGDQGPDVPMSQSAPGRCGGCGFLVRLAGPLALTFGVCANEFANDDARVVSLDHGCGAHSEAQLRKKQLPPPVPEHAFDSLSRGDWEQF